MVRSSQRPNLVPTSRAVPTTSKPRRCVQRDRAGVGRLDAGHHHVRARLARAGDQRAQQLGAEAAPLVAVAHVDRVLDGVPVAVLRPPGRPVREADHRRRRPPRRRPNGARGSPRARPARPRVSAAASSTWPSSARSRRCGWRGSARRRRGSASRILYSGVMSTIVDSMAAFGERLRARAAGPGLVDRAARRGVGRLPGDDQQDRARREQPDRRRARQAVGGPRAQRRRAARPGARPGGGPGRGRQAPAGRTGRPGAPGRGAGRGAPGRRHPAVARPGHRLPAPADVDARVPAPRSPRSTLPAGRPGAVPGGGVRVHRAARLGAVRAS